MGKRLFLNSWLLYIACSLMTCSINPRMDFVEHCPGEILWN